MLLGCLVFLALINVSLGQLDLCQKNRGNPANWQSVLISGADVVETLHRNHPQGSNFCYGSGLDGNTGIDFYADLSCDSGPDLRLQEEPVCSSASSRFEVPLCVDETLRRSVQLAAESTDSAVQLARHIQVLTRPQRHAIVVAKVDGTVSTSDIVTNLFQDKNVCLVRRNSADPQFDFVVVVAKLKELPEDTLDRDINQKPAFNQAIDMGIIKTPSAAIPENYLCNITNPNPLLGARCNCEELRYPGRWLLAEADTRCENIELMNAAEVGDNRVGLNYCADVRRVPGSFALHINTKYNSECREMPNQSKLNTQRQRIPIRKFAVTSSEQPSLPCGVDEFADECADEAIRTAVLQEMLAAEHNDAYLLAKDIQRKLVDPDQWHVSVVYLPPTCFGTARSVEYDRHYCTSLRETKSGRKALVRVAKLEF